MRNDKHSVAEKLFSAILKGENNMIVYFPSLFQLQALDSERNFRVVVSKSINVDKLQTSPNITHRSR